MIEEMKRNKKNIRPVARYGIQMTLPKERWEREIKMSLWIIKQKKIRL